MADETTVAEPTTTQAPVPTPAKPQPLRTKIGDKFRAEMEKAAKGVEQPKPDTEPPKDEPAKPEAAPVKPSSPLDVVTAAKPEEPKPADPLKEFDDKNPNWKRARELMGTQHKRIQELETQLKTQPKGDPEAVKRLEAQAAEVTQLKELLASRDESIKAINFRLSDEYKQAEAERENIVAKTIRKFEAFAPDKSKSGDLREALSLPEGKVRNNMLREAMADLEPDDRAAVRILIEGVDSAVEKLSDMEKNAPKNWDALVSKRDQLAAEEQARQLKTVETNFSKVADTLLESTPTLRIVPEDVPDAASWNGDILKAKETGQNVLKGVNTTFEQSAEIAFKGAHYDSLSKRYLALYGEHRETLKRLSEYESGGPDFKGASRPSTEPAKTRGEKYQEVLNKLRSGGSFENE